MSIEEQARRVKALDMEKYLDIKIKDTIGGRDFVVKHFANIITVVSYHKLSRLMIAIIEEISSQLRIEPFSYRPIGKQRQEVLDILKALDIGGYAVVSNNDCFSKKMGRIVAKLRYLRIYSFTDIDGIIDTLYNRVLVNDDDIGNDEYEEFMPDVASSGTRSVRDEIKRIKIRNKMVSKL